MKKKKIFIIVIVTFVSIIIVGIWITNLINTTILVSILEALKSFASKHWDVIVSTIVAVATSVGLVWKILSTHFQRKHERKMQQAQHKHEKEMEKLRQEYEEKLRQQAKDRRRANKMLGHFVIPLIIDLDGKIHYIDNKLNREQFINPTQSPLKPKYEFAYESILKKDDDTWIRKEVNKYNELAKAIDDDMVLRFRQAIRETIKQMFPDDMDIPNKDMEVLEYMIGDNNITSVDGEGEVYKFWDGHIDEFSKIRGSKELQHWINEIKRCLGEAKEVATKLKDGLEKLKEQYEDTHDIEEDEIEIIEEKEKSLRGLI